MPFGTMDSAVFFLIAHSGAENPLVLEYFIHGGPLGRVDLEHPTNDVTTLSGEYAQKPPWPFDDFLLVPARCAGPGFNLGALGMVVVV